MAKPMKARAALTCTWAHNSPLSASPQAAWRTASGSGRMRLDSQPRRAESSQPDRIRIGSSHGSKPARPFLKTWLTEDMILFPPGGDYSLAIDTSVDFTSATTSVPIFN
jgi:hypothetical protein